ncbi:MAG: hypothetical protein ACLQE9_18110 [Roseiarcus sp.]
MAPRDADIALLEVAQREIDHRGHQRVGKGVTLVEHRQLEIRHDRGEGQVDLASGRSVAELALK